MGRAEEKQERGHSHQHQVDADEMTKMTKMTKRRGITFKRFSLLAFATLAVASVLVTCVEAIECDPGKEPNGDNCKKCGPGLISDGKSKCTKCKGNEVTGTDHTICKVCEAGKEPSPNKEVCVKCPAGEFSRGAGSKCTKCRAGTYSEKPGAEACQDCESGITGPNRDKCDD